MRLSENKHFRRLIRFIPLGIIIFIGIVYGFYNTITRFSQPYCYSSISELPANHCGILLGTSKYLRGGKENKYYTYRINAAIELLRAGKIEYIIVSGDNRHRSYNEPLNMQRDLLAAGIDKSKIVMDYAGFRTLDSVIRAFHIFGQTSFTIISQPFHNERAIYIGRHYGLQVTGFNAEEVDKSLSYRVKIREIGARILVAWDLWIGKEPHFYGEKVPIPE